MVGVNPTADIYTEDPPGWCPSVNSPKVEPWLGSAPQKKTSGMAQDLHISSPFVMKLLCRT